MSDETSGEFKHVEWRDANPLSRQAVIYFLLDTLSCILSSTNYFYLSLVGTENVNIFSQLCLMMYYLNIHTILAGYSILYLKCSQDIINDVNKL